MSDPVTKKKTGVFEDFPLPERKHFDAHRAARGSLGSGFAPMEEEKQAFAHIRRDSAKGDSHGSSTIGGVGESPWKSSYQAFTDGTDDIGKVRKLSRKKSQSNVPGHPTGRSELALFGTGRFLASSGRENQAENHGERLHMPGYTGHVPKQPSLGGHARSRNPADKSLLAENYRHNVVGYTGHVK